MLTVSAVIPTYNGTVYLREAVRSALAQTYELLEIIVVDDGSREDIQKVLAPFSPKITYVRQENAGPAAARNHGISLATGDLVALLDDDDIWHPTKTAEQVTQLTKNPTCALVYSDPEWIDENGNIIPHETATEFYSGHVYAPFLTKNRIASPSVTMIRKDVFNAIGLFDDSSQCISCEDYDLWLRITQKYEVLFCPGTLASYRIRASSISHNLDKHYNAHMYVFDKLVSSRTENAIINDKIFYAALDVNIYNTMKRFAYNYYYMPDERRKARHLMLKSLQKHPCCIKDILYLVLLIMPTSLFQILRKLKQKALLSDA